MKITADTITAYLVPLVVFLVLLPGCQAIVDREANELAQRFYDLALTKCGDSWYYITKRPIVGTQGQFETVIYEFKGVSTGAAGYGITEAEKLNGYEWRGQTFARATVLREYSQGRWWPWREGAAVPEIKMIKRNGRWFLDGGLLDDGEEASSYKYPKKLSCEQIPP